MEKKAPDTTPVVLMNFTHVYEQESFYKKEPHCWIDLTDLEGVNGYCDENAVKDIRERIARLSPYGLHFIDSGNYHYVSKFWTDRIREDFVLVLFDHHTDMQPSRFGELLSCGSWVKDVLDENPFVRKVVIIGADKHYLDHIDEAYRDRLVCFTTDSLGMEKNWRAFAQAHVRLPVFISIDKDVLSPKEEITDWDQGNMSLAMLEGILQILIRRRRILGIDICGECPELLGEGLEAVRVNDSVNEKLVNFLKDQIFMKHNRAVICRIEDPDFGCEERPEGRPAACRVFLKELPENGDGSRCKDKVFAMLMEEKLLEERGLAEGMTVVLDEDGTLAKILETEGL